MITSRNRLDGLWQVLRCANLIDILIVGALLEDEGAWTAVRVVGKDPIYLDFGDCVLEICSVENENGCELQWKVIDSVCLPTPVYEDDPNDVEFKFVLYSVFSHISVYSPSTNPEVKIITASALLDSADQRIVRGISLELSSGVVCRFDPCTFDGLQMRICATGHLYEELNSACEVVLLSAG